MGVVIFPSLPFMGVMLFPSFVLGNASGEGSTFLVPFSLFSILFSLHLLSSPSPSLSFSLLFFLFFFPISFSLFPFLSRKLFQSLFSSSPIFHFLRVFLFSFFFRELLVLCTSEVYGMTLLIVIECNFIGIKGEFSFFNHELAHSDVCNFPTNSMAELFEMSKKITNKCSIRHLKNDNALFKITNRGLLIKTLKEFSIPSMIQNVSLLRLELVIARSDHARYDVWALPVGS